MEKRQGLLRDFNGITTSLVSLLILIRLIKAYKLITAMPVSHMFPATPTATCMGFALLSTFGVKFSSSTGFTKAFTGLIPDRITGLFAISMSEGMVSTLGIRLKTLWYEIGQTSLSPPF